MKSWRTHAFGSNDSTFRILREEGIKFVFTTRLIFSSMIIDFIATFFASASTLMPIFAVDILKVGRISPYFLFREDAWSVEDFLTFKINVLKFPSNLKTEKGGGNENSFKGFAQWPQGIFNTHEGS